MATAPLAPPCCSALRRQPTRFDALDIAWTLVLAPAPSPIPRSPFACSRRRSASLPGHPSRGRLLGAAHYRAGQYDAAVQRLNEAIALFRGGTPHDWLFLAMAQHRLGRRDEAGKSLAKAVSLVDEKAIAAQPWRQRLEWTVLRDEAQALIQAKVP